MTRRGGTRCTDLGMTERIAAGPDAAGKAVVLVEHDLEAIETTDHVIDLGPGGGEAGRRVVPTGTPAELSEADEVLPRPTCCESRAALILRRPPGRHQDGGRPGHHRH